MEQMIKLVIHSTKLGISAIRAFIHDEDVKKYIDFYMNESVYKWIEEKNVTLDLFEVKRYCLVDGEGRIHHDIKISVFDNIFVEDRFD